MSSSKVKADAKEALGCDKERESRTTQTKAKDQKRQEDNSSGKVKEAKKPLRREIGGQQRSRETGGERW
jgi:hypothetical protein